MPPESSWGRARSKPSRPKAAKSGCARARASSRDAPPRRTASAALSIARSHGSRLSRWGMSTAGSARTRPASGACRPHTSSSSVVLPQPLGPTTATISPAPTSRSTPSSARTEPNARLTPARLAVPPPSTFRGSCAGASSLVVIAPSAGITPQVRRVSAGSLGAISAGLRQPPCWSVMDASAGARRRASPLRLTGVPSSVAAGAGGRSSPVSGSTSCGRCVTSTTRAGTVNSCSMPLRYPFGRAACAGRREEVWSLTPLRVRKSPQARRGAPGDARIAPHDRL